MRLTAFLLGIVFCILPPSVLPHLSARSVLKSKWFGTFTTHKGAKDREFGRLMPPKPLCHEYISGPQGQETVDSLVFLQRGRFSRQGEEQRPGIEPLKTSLGKERQNSPSRQQGDVVLSSPLTCGIAVDAGPDQDLCFPGGQVQLSGSVSGPVLSYSWSPPAGLSDPFSLNPTAFVTQSTTYQLTASSVETDVNLIVNGDFEQGNTGFTSDYLYAPNDLSVAGTYSVTTSPALVWSNFPDCVDHTSGSGMSMVVNGDASPGDNIWCQTISVTPNSEFIFSFWATTLIPLFPGQLQIFVNGQPVSPVFGLSSDFCSWTFFSQQFSVGNVNSMDLCIVSQGAETLIGNDFALDDLVLHPICTQTDEVNINLIQVEASAPFLLPLSCANPQLTIQATASPSGSNVSYQWMTSDGNIVSGANTLNPVVDMAGTYTLSVTYQSATATCTAMATTIVINDPNDPQVLIAMPDTLSCSNPSIWIDGGGTTTGPDITYSWTTLDGHILSDPTLLSIQVDAPGTYILQLTDTSTGCTDQGEVLVVLDESSPQAVITPDTLNLNCSLPQAWLDGSASSQGASFTYLWQSSVSLGPDTTSDSLWVDTSGLYQLIVTDTIQQCSDTAVAVVLQDFRAPGSSLSGDSLITCYQPEIWLQASWADTLGSFDFSWETPDGHFASPTDSSSVLVDSAGTYLFVNTLLETGCSDTISFGLSANKIAPVPVLPDTLFLTCAQPALWLADGGISQTTYQYSWSVADSLLSQADSLYVQTAANYQLEILDSLNGCMALDSVLVLENTQMPLISLVPPDTLSCQVLSVMLDASASDQGGHLWPVWSTTSGNIVGDSMGVYQVLADAPGWYVFSLMDTLSGCFSVDSLFLQVSDDVPQVNVDYGSGLLGCVGELSVVAQVTSSSTQLSTSWTTSNGSFLQGADSLSIYVQQAGFYWFTVQDLENGCSVVEFFEVETDTLTPVVQLQDSIFLNCYVSQDTVSADIQTSSDHPFVLSWTDEQGNSLPLLDSVSVLVDQQGNYQLIVTDALNGCTTSAFLSALSDFSQPQIDLAEADSLTCTSPVLTLQPQVDAGGHPLSYAWSSSDGHIIGASDGASLQLDSAGLYQLAVQDLENGCTAVDSVQVYSNQDYPLALIAEPSVLDCATPELLLDGTASSQGAVFSLQWTSADGQIVGGEQSPGALIASEGTYILEVTNTQNGCVSRDTVQVEEDFHQPDLQLSLLSDTLNCYEPESQVTVSVNTYAAHPYALSWTDSSGVELSFADPQQVVFTQEGSYELTVTDSVNNCTATAVVELWSDMNPPQIDLAEADTLTCVSPVLVLQPQVDADGHPLSYAWSSSDGHIIGASDGASLQLDSAGLYQLAVQDLENGCTAVDSVQVYSSFDPPILNLAEADTLTCYESYVEVLVEVNPAFQSYAYNWSTVDGHFVEEPDSALAQIDWSAWYGVEVTNQETGCVAEDSIWIEEGRVFPDAQASVSDEISCAMPEVMLSAEGSSMGDNMAYSWTSSEGVFVGPVDSFEVWVAASGSYLLEVVNTENGCSSWAVALVQADTALPALVLSVPDTISCDQPSVGLSANTDLPDSLAIWSWNVLDGVLEGDLESDSVQALSGGVYVVSLQNSSNACVRTDTVEVQMDTLPPSVLAGEDVYFPCEEESVWLLGSVNFGSPIVLQWETTDGELLSDPNQAILEVGAPGTYVLEAIDESNGCSSKDTVLVLQDWPVDFELDVVVPTCADTLGAISIVSVEGGIGPFVYSIDGGEHFEEKADFENLQAGSYVVVVEDAQACRLEELVSLSEPPVFTLEFAEEVHFIRYGESVLLSPDWFGAEPLHWTWEPSESLSCSDCAEPLASPLETTSYLVSVESEEGCRAEGKVLVVVDEREPIYMPNAFSPNGDGFNDLFGPHLPEGSEITLLNLSIYDRWGNLVFRAEGGGVWDGSFRGKAAQAGVYVYQLEALDREGRPLLLKGEVVLVR